MAEIMEYSALLDKAALCEARSQLPLLIPACSLP